MSPAQWYIEGLPRLGWLHRPRNKGRIIRWYRQVEHLFTGGGVFTDGFPIDTLPHRPIDAWEMHIENRRLFRVDEPMDLSGQPCTLVSQPAFLEAIVQQMQNCPQFELRQGVSVQDLLWKDSRVSGVQLSDGQRLEADLVIGADGRNSLVRQKSKLELNKSDQSFDILWFKLPMAEQFERENVFYSFLKGRDGFGFLRGSEGDMQLGWSIHRDDPIDWQKMNWSEKFASTAPKWLSNYFRAQARAATSIASRICKNSLKCLKAGIVCVHRFDRASLLMSRFRQL